eukprot:m.41040 g.41040  ORF g.41040 m.41040 type:complete len:417 (+) comp11423_c0_seq2:168-1418(+)
MSAPGTFGVAAAKQLDSSSVHRDDGAASLSLRPTVTPLFCIPNQLTGRCNSSPVKVGPRVLEGWGYQAQVLRELNKANAANASVTMAAETEECMIAFEAADPMTHRRTRSLSGGRTRAVSAKRILLPFLKFKTSLSKVFQRQRSGPCRTPISLPISASAPSSSEETPRPRAATVCTGPRQDSVRVITSSNSVANVNHTPVRRRPPPPLPSATTPATAVTPVPCESRSSLPPSPRRSSLPSFKRSASRSEPSDRRQSKNFCNERRQSLAARNDIAAVPSMCTDSDRISRSASQLAGPMALLGMSPIKPALKSRLCRSEDCRDAQQRQPATLLKTEDMDDMDLPMDKENELVATPIRFDHQIRVKSTYSKGEYNRKGSKAWLRLTMQDRMRIKLELNDFKRHDMVVHPESERFTRFHR